MQHMKPKKSDADEAGDKTQRAARSRGKLPGNFGKRKARSFSGRSHDLQRFLSSRARQGHDLHKQPPSWHLWAARPPPYWKTYLSWHG